MYGNQFGTGYMPYGSPYSNMYSGNQPNNGLIKVTGLDGAKAYQMPPNSVVALFDANNDIFYVKSTDGAGFPTIRAFRFAPVSVEQSNNDYVTRTEFNQLKEMILNGKQSISGEQSDTTESNANVK